MIIQAVIGAGFGDEGKGRLTDALAHRAVSEHGHATVVRFNGGAQAGHTVCVNNTRHVFHHWSSGALAGAVTHLGPEFVCHPMVFGQETQTLQKLGARLVMRVDPRCRITTPYDVLINQATEFHRAKTSSRHGSCGMGFGEVIQRCLDPATSIRMSDLSSEDALRHKLGVIKNEYVEFRCKQLDVPFDLLTPYLNNDDILHHFLQDVSQFNQHVYITSPTSLSSDPCIVFEGAQGLELDEHLGAFPYVTRSQTGLPYIVQVMHEAKLDRLEAFYVTRIYKTRHGAGPMSFERPLPEVDMVDPTNQPNAFQGHLRQAPLDPERLIEMVQKDLARSNHKHINPSWVVTCLDQVKSHCPQICNKQEKNLPVEQLLATLSDFAPISATTFGPKRDQIQFLDSLSSSYSYASC